MIRTILFIPLCSIAGIGALPGGEGSETAPRVLRGHAGAVSQVSFNPEGSILASASFDATIKLWRMTGAASGEELATLAGHAGRVLAVAFSPDGKSILSGGEDRTLKLWKVPPALPERISGHGGRVLALVLTPDGRLISAGEDRTVRVWDRSMGKADLVIEGLASPPTALAVSPDGVWLAGALLDQTVRVWALRTPPPPPPQESGAAAADLIRQGDTWRFFKGTAAPGAAWRSPGFDDSGWAAGGSGFGYSQDLRELATVKTRLEDMKDRYLTLFIRRTFKVPDPASIEKIRLRVFYDDGFVAYLNGSEVARENVDGDPPGHDRQAKTVIEPKEAALDLTPHISKLVAGENVLALQGHNCSLTSTDFLLAPVLEAAMRPAGPAESPGREEPVKPGSEVRKIDGIGGAVLAVAMSPEGKLVASAGEAGAIRIHSVKDGSERERLEGHAGALRAVLFLPEGRLASAGADGTLRIWSLAEKKAVSTLRAHEGAATALSLRPDGKVLASSGEDGTVRLWDPASGKGILSFQVHKGPVPGLSFSPDGRSVASGSADGTLAISSAESGKLLDRVGIEGKIRSVAAAGDGHHYFAGPGRDIFDWRFEAVSSVKSFSGHDDIVHSVAFSPDGRRAASGSADRTVRVWDLAQGSQERSFVAHGSSTYCVAWSPDGKSIATGGFDAKVKLWSAKDGSLLKTFDGHEEGVFCLAFTPDGGTLLSGGSDRSIRRWNVLEGMPAGTFPPHPEWVSDLKLLPGTPRAVSADYGGNLFLWALPEGKSLLAMKVHAIVHCLAVSPDGRWIATANQDGSIFLLPAPSGAR